MAQLDCYLFFNGNCAEAIRFYERTLGGKLQMMMTYGQSPQPQQGPSESSDRIMHASLSIDGRTLMASDMPEDQAGQGMKGFALSLNYPTADEARRIFTALAEGGTVTMRMDKTFWAEAFGMLTDRFGTPWMVSGEAQS
jgi:PhnB protein